MSVRIEGRYLGAKKVRLVHEPSGAELITDAPRDNQGEGSAFSPTDLVAGALAACMMTILAMAAEHDGLNVTGAELRVEKHMESNPRRIAAIEVVLRLPARIPPEQRERLERAARACPVYHSLRSDMKVDTRFLWDL